MRLAAVAMVLGACGAPADPSDAAVLLPDAQVDISGPDVAMPDVADTTADTSRPDTSGRDTTGVSDTSADTSRPDTADTALPDTGLDAADTSNPATCSTPTLIESYPPPFPPSPFGQWPVAESCIGAAHDTLIVLGCPSNDDGSPSRCQERRAELADHLHEAGLARHIIVSGAAVHTPHVEADALAALLIGRGVPEADIVKEPLARHTDENLYYSTRLMQDRGWLSAIVVSDEPGHLVYTGLCDANCCVGLGRMTLWSFDVGRNGRVNAGHYALSPPGPGVAANECDHLADLLLCTKLEERHACEGNLRLDAP